jgi:hypothetical protein
MDRRLAADLFYAWLNATLWSGIPSTLWALATGGNMTEATRAAGAMLLPASSPTWKLFLAAALVHCAVSLFWAALLVLILPRRRTLLWALVAAVAIGLLDLRVIAPRFFPEIAALPFWPQMADHLMWGACLALALQFRRRAR